MRTTLAKRTDYPLRWQCTERCEGFWGRWLEELTLATAQVIATLHPAEGRARHFPPPRHRREERADVDRGGLDELAEASSRCPRRPEPTDGGVCSTLDGKRRATASLHWY
jgi:hypothetical protein